MLFESGSCNWQINDSYVVMSSLGSSGLSPSSFSLEMSLILLLSTLNAFFFTNSFQTGTITTGQCVKWNKTWRNFMSNGLGNRVNWNKSRIFFSIPVLNHISIPKLLEKWALSIKTCQVTKWLQMIFQSAKYGHLFATLFWCPLLVGQEIPRTNLLSFHWKQRQPFRDLKNLQPRQEFVTQWSLIELSSQTHWRQICLNYLCSSDLRNKPSYSSEELDIWNLRWLLESLTGIHAVSVLLL